MPSCYCRWAKCEGKLVSKRLFDDHQRQDKRAQVNAALEATNQAIERQDANIASYIAGATLSDETAGSSTKPGGRLWAREIRDPSESAYNHSTSSHSPVTDALQIIDDAREELAHLTITADLGLRNICKPDSTLDLFPLRSCLRDASSLCDLLNSITVQRTAVQEAKRPVAEGAAALISKLRKAQSKWAKDLNLLSDEQNQARTFDTGSVFSLSVSLILLTYLNVYTGHHFSPILKGITPVIQASIFTMVALQIIVHASRRGCHFLLAMLRYIVQLSLMRQNMPLTASETRLLSEFPVDPDSAARKLRLDCHETVHAVCPNSKCHKTYAPTFRPNSPVPIYPLMCTHKQFKSGPVCGTRLTYRRIFGNTEVEVPIKRFVSFSFKDFVASLTSRPGFEDMMDACSSSQDDVMRDIFDGQFLRQLFKGPDGAPFRSTNHDARYTFSLCIDFFNPYMNKQSGKKVSIGIISIVCLSLPPALRYKAENMFLVGIIPGPHEPPLTAVNHYLTPIVDEFEEFWRPGVRFSQTYNYPVGRLVFCALILVVCDLLAARKAAGFAACTHEHFCSVCHCTKSREGLGNTDYESWKPRTDAGYREAAKKYLDAENMNDRTDEFNRSGVRWSELLRLPYFDISRSVIVDSMHNLFLGLIKEHFRGVLGIDLPVLKEKALKVTVGPYLENMTENDIKGVEKLQTWLEAPASHTFPGTQEQGVKKLSTVNMNSLIFMCQELGCSPTSKSKYYKKDYAIELLNWRLRQIESDGASREDAVKHGFILEEAEMAEIRSDLQKILTPSWLASVPTNLGCAAHGKLKADQWRALGTVHLPISLTRLWSKHMNQNLQTPRALRCHSILLVTMALVSAVILATSRSVTPQNAAAYRDYMLSYLEGVKFLFPEYKMRPNHHMAVHIYDYLLLFGPVHSWWTFPFERMIGAVQRMPHNGKIGELEETIARAYMRSANLRAMVTRVGCPEVIQHSETIFRKFVDSHKQDLLQTDMQASTFLLRDDEPTHGNEVTEPNHLLSHELRAAFESARITAAHRVRLLSNITLSGLIYSTFTKHQGNSCILFQRSEAAAPLPAQIISIVQFTATDRLETYFAVRCHKPANLSHDPFSSFLVLSAAIWDAELSTLEIIRPTQILCHFACLPISICNRQYVAALSLSRVRYDSALEHASLSLQHIRRLRLQ